MPEELELKPPKCEECGQEVESYHSDYIDLTAQERAEKTLREFGSVLCYRCLTPLLLKQLGVLSKKVIGGV